MSGLLLFLTISHRTNASLFRRLKHYRSKLVPWTRLLHLDRDVQSDTCETKRVVRLSIRLFQTLTSWQHSINSAWTACILCRIRRCHLQTVGTLVCTDIHPAVLNANFFLQQYFKGNTHPSILQHCCVFGFQLSLLTPQWPSRLSTF